RFADREKSTLAAGFSCGIYFLWDSPPLLRRNSIGNTNLFIPKRDRLDGGWQSRRGGGRRSANRGSFLSRPRSRHLVENRTAIYVDLRDVSALLDRAFPEGA